MWKNLSHRYQSAIVVPMNGRYRCSYDDFEVYDWRDPKDNWSAWGKAGCWCNPNKTQK